MDEICNDQAQKSHQDIQGRGKKMSSPIPLVMRIIILFLLEGGNLLLFHWA
jgi:hypothetical protein